MFVSQVIIIWFLDFILVIVFGSLRTQLGVVAPAHNSQLPGGTGRREECSKCKGNLISSNACQTLFQKQRQK